MSFKVDNLVKEVNALTLDEFNDLLSGLEKGNCDVLYELIRLKDENENLHDEIDDLTDINTELKIKIKKLENIIFNHVYVLIFDEVSRAEALYPNWPSNVVEQVSIMMEEAGECVKEANDVRFKNKPLENLKKELIQTGAMCVRVFKNLEVEYEMEKP